MSLLSDLLRRQREQRGLSQEELAAMVEPPLSPDTISNLEQQGVVVNATSLGDATMTQPRLSTMWRNAVLLRRVC